MASPKVWSFMASPAIWVGERGGGGGRRGEGRRGREEEREQ